MTSKLILSLHAALTFEHHQTKLMAHRACTLVFQTKHALDNWSLYICSRKELCTSNAMTAYSHAPKSTVSKTYFDVFTNKYNLGIIAAW